VPQGRSLELRYIVQSAPPPDLLKRSVTADRFRLTLEIGPQEVAQRETQR
jgi:hypothetical protein